MVYHLHELQRRMVEPWSELAAGSSRALVHPKNPFRVLPNVRALAASQALFHRMTKRYDKPAWGIHEVVSHGMTVSVAEEAVLSEPFCKLVHFTRRTHDADVAMQLRKDPRVLIVAPLSGHHATLLRDTVRTLLQDHDVYVTEWADARDVPVIEGVFHLDDYVHTVMRCIRLLGAESLHVMAVCQPTVPVLGAVSLLAQAGEKTPRTLTLMGGPIDARKSPTEVNTLATEHPLGWFEKNMIHKVPGPYAGKGRRVYPGFFQLTAFVMMNPKNHFKSYFKYWVDSHKGESGAAARATHEQFYDEYNSVLDMDAEYYLETVRVVFQEFALAKGTWDVRGVRVRPSAITDTAIFTVEGEKDDISGLGQTEAAHALCSSVPQENRRHLFVKGAGHYGIFSGHRWRENTYPILREFIRNHSMPIV
ncbi:MAG: polyhydroxyalkanoate depolymerase [Polyangiaceae bacterium]|nr:polyhydroxyalkanoate depolymerase [Polyangiaceae bacterium]